MQHFSAHDAQSRFGQMLDVTRDEPVTIERNGRPIAVLMSKDAFDDLAALKLERLRAEVQRGIDAIEQGNCTDVTEDDLTGFADRIKTAGRRRKTK